MSTQAQQWVYFLWVCLMQTQFANGCYCPSISEHICGFVCILGLVNLHKINHNCHNLVPGRFGKTGPAFTCNFLEKYNCIVWKKISHTHYKRHGYLCKTLFVLRQEHGLPRVWSANTSHFSETRRVQVPVLFPGPHPSIRHKKTVTWSSA